MTNDFLDNRQSYHLAKKPYKKGGIYFTRDGERIKYKCSCDKFDWFVWADKPNPDGEFFVSWFYEKKPDVAGCSLHPVHGWIIHA